MLWVKPIETGMHLPNKALHPTAITVRLIAAGELDRYAKRRAVIADILPSQDCTFPPKTYHMEQDLSTHHYL